MHSRSRPCGLMDKASDFGSEDCRFESCHGRLNFIIHRFMLFYAFHIIIIELDEVHRLDIEVKILGRFHQHDINSISSDLGQKITLTSC